MRVDTAASLFKEHCRIGRNLSVNTLRAYSADLTHFVTYIGPEVCISGVTKDQMGEYTRCILDGKRLKETTVKRRLATLKVLFRWLERARGGGAERISPVRALDQIAETIASGTRWH